ncbi:hypothetical protein A1O7_05949 [Cladophialophora yegresii CBS 114405]|uniref:Myosin class II heavy chain n=1 Tax=Cladophialophora yegresii CBS 114405 TaxID=1182544 RepID=W9VSI6_9EURO|nr:uncharacterized protein A1O7_05949 [Cladophialophora yegresii CBS 114405]EXJ58523.1 hypothetical protein A1O7_05949 [Cladophialophora yegresii CBS 114405]
MNVDGLSHFENSPSDGHHTGFYPPGRPDSFHSLKEHSLSSTPSENDWVSPFTLPPLPTLRRDRDQAGNFRSPEYLRQRDGSGAYYAAAWGSPYATPSPRRTPQPPSDPASHRLDFEDTPLPSSSTRSFLDPSDDIGGSRPRSWRRIYPNTATLDPAKELRNLRSERPNWLSDSDDSGSETGQKAGENTPTRVAYLDSWGASPADSVSRVPVKHRSTESLATVTQDTFHASGYLLGGSKRLRTPLPPVGLSNMAEQESESLDTPEMPLPVLPHRVSPAEDDMKPPESPTLAARPRPTSMHSYQRPKKKVIWKGKACIIALPLTDRESAGLPPLLTQEEIQARIQEWTDAGYSVDGFELNHLAHEGSQASSGQSRPVYPDPSEVNAEQKLRQFHVHIPDQAEWESWVESLKEEKLRALGVSPSGSEAPPSTRSPFSATMSRVSSTAYPGLTASPPIAPSSSASNPLRATSNPFSPSLLSSAGISPQPGSVASSQFNGPPKNMHGYKPSMAHPGFHGRISPYEPIPPQPNAFGNGARPNIQPLSSRQNSFSPNHPLHLPNMGEVLSQPMHVRAPTMQFGGEQARNQLLQSRGHVPLQHASQHTPSPVLPQRVDSLSHTPQFSESSHTPIEIAHPTPKSHRHNLSMALQREIDETEAALHAKHDSLHAEDPENYDQSLRKASVVDDTVNEELPILRRPETMTVADERSDIETNPSIAATPMLMDDKNPFMNWQALSDAAKAESKPAPEATPTITKFNVEAKEFDPRAGFLSSNFSFGAPAFMPVRRAPSKPTPPVDRGSASKNRFSITRLNADAPAFTPSFVPQAAPKETPFSFSSATFNVDAPVFNPSQSQGARSSDNEASHADGPTNNMSSIFGNVIIGSGSKATRRASKPGALLATKLKGVQSDVSEAESTDDEGRPVAPADRQKRARRHDSDGDRSPVFADSAPFHHRRILSEIVDDVDANGSEVESPKKHFDGWAYIPADETPLDGDKPVAAQAKTEDANEVDEAESAFTFADARDAAMFNEARPPLDIDQKLETEQESEPESQAKVESEAEEPNRPSDVSRGYSRKPKSSLSALAKPFEFNPPVSGSLVASSIAPPPKARGLEASKYATLPSPPTKHTADLSSLRADLPHLVEKDHESVNDAEDTVEVFEDNDQSSVEEVVEVIEEQSTDNEAEPPPELLSDPTKELGVHPQVEEDGFAMPGPSLRHQEQPVPSFEEIDAVMKHLEDHPELGVERNDTPIQSTPLIDIRSGGNFRSDAPSPSPRRIHDNKSAPSDTSYPPSYGLGIGIHKLNSGRDDVSDWGDALPAPEAAKLQLRSQFFDGHVNDLVGGILENRLGPLERALETIQHSLALITTQPTRKKDRRSMSTEQKESDADDEDDYDAFEGFSSYRSRSPLARRGERRQDLIRAAVAEAMAAYQLPAQPQPTIDMTEVNGVLQEMRELAQQKGSQNTQNELKTIMEDVISHHPRLRGSRVREDHEAAELKLKPQIDGLESMLKISQEHAAEEARLRRKAEEEINELKLRLRIAEEEASQYRESSEEAQHTLEAFVEEKESYKNLERDLEGLTLKNTALEHTLEEYRVSSDQWRQDIRDERANNKDLKRTLRELHQQLQEQTQSRGGLRGKIERVQSQMAQVIHDMHAEQEDWRNKEHSLQSRIAIAQEALEQERRHREKAELDLDVLDKEHKANLHLKNILAQAQSEVSRLDELVASLREENRALDTKAFNLDRELTHTKNSKDAELATSVLKVQAELESALAQIQNVRADSDAQIIRMQGRLEDAELRLEEQKAKHDSVLAETLEAHRRALGEADEKKESALGERLQAHEKMLDELRDRHAREIQDSFDARTMLEQQFNERLSLGDDKVKHLENKVADLEDRLAITKSAARAAVEAATAKGVNLPTPASSVVASPPQRAATASMSYAKGTEVPEKISPQALRESIMVLQDQLQNREQQIEQLEAQLAAADKDAPAKLKERETEISWLRELLSVRVDDLDEITSALSKPDFDRDSVRDATIRLRANLQMEQQLRERAPGGGMTSSFPSISSLSSYAQSPRALPLAAAAAWGNWRKARDTSIGALSDLATNLGNQTPSKSTVGSPASFLSGMITPPATSQKTPTSSDTPLQAPPTMRPLAAAAAQARKGGGPEARPLKAYNPQPRALSSRQAEKRPERSPSLSKPELPQTPTQVKNQPSFDLTADVDEDASPLEEDTQYDLLEAAEPLPQ